MNWPVYIGLSDKTAVSKSILKTAEKESNDRAGAIWYTAGN